MASDKTFGKSSFDIKQREIDRLAALAAFDLLDTPREPAFERIARLIKQIYMVDIGLVSLIDGHRQWYKANSGLPFDEAPRKDTFCRYVLDIEKPLIVEDATDDPRFHDNPAVTGDTHIRFYAGVPLRTQDGHVIGTVCALHTRPRKFAAREIGILEELSGAVMDQLEMQRLATTDSLTRALTRRAFKTDADQMLAIALRHHQPMSCIVLDVDHFKTVNDTLGHAAGDEVLQSVSEICQSNLRAGDLFGRLGGEEFCILLPQTDTDGARAVAEKLREAIAAFSFCESEGGLHVTASFGISTLSIAARDLETLQAQADAAMYLAKKQGRNRCVDWRRTEQDEEIGARRRVLKAGAILFNNRRSMIDCTVKAIGADGASIVVSNSVGIPADFILILKGENFETACRIIAQHERNLEVSFSSHDMARSAAHSG